MEVTHYGDVWGSGVKSPCFLRLNIRSSEFGSEILRPQNLGKRRINVVAELMPEHNLVCFMLFLLHHHHHHQSALQPLVGFSLLYDFVPQSSIFTLLSPVSHFHLL